MDTITSRSNPLINETAKLKDKKHREEKRAFLFEGIKLAREAISSGVVIENVFMTEKCSKRYPDIANMKQTVLISDSVCKKLSENSSPEGIICRAKYMEDLHFVADENIGGIPPCLFLSSLQDPGNLGTIIRTSSAFGKKTIVLSSDCADIYNQKTVRASMGTLFRTKIIRTDDLENIIEKTKARGIDVYATALTSNAISLQQVSCPKNCCFVLGNEGHGLSDSIIKKCSGTVIIPMEKDTESLNVSSAATVILWEAYR